MASRKPIEEIIMGHVARDASLLRLFQEKQIDLRAPRSIECHFWSWSEEESAALAEALKQRGFEILRRTRAAIANDPARWNLEASVKQSIELTMTREFIGDLVKLADSYGGLYDGWGTSI